MASTQRNKPGPCRYFASPAGCGHGSSCRYSHAATAPQLTQTTRGAANTKVQSTVQGKGMDNTFLAWRKLIPRASETRPSRFGYKLTQYFQLAYTLVQGELDILQKTVTELATEQGVLGVREMIDERLLFCGNDSERINIWRTCLRPFFLILTEPRVVRSAILEVHTGTIYNVVLGYNGSRLEILFNFLVDLATKWQPPLIGDDDGPKSQYLELCTAILAKTVDCNTQALVNEGIPPIVQRLRSFVNGLELTDRSFWTLQAANHLEYIQRRLSLVKKAPRDNAANHRGPSHAAFVLRRDLPGTLSTEGPRHDNDFEDITKIRILPTLSEIMSTRTDYRPFCDPSQLHLPGIQGVIDRCFRLLRDDMVGQLKEAISEELQLLQNPENGAIEKARNSIRTYSYTVMDIYDITCAHRSGGIEFRLKIEQPLSAGRLADDARRDWWNMSKRLEIGALVCLLQKETDPVFCIVSESTLRPNLLRYPPRNTKEASNDAKRRDLYSNKDFAYVSLNLAEPTDTDLKVLLRAFQSEEPIQRSLVEFPGVLLPSFKPTLSALQHIFKTLDLPFTDLIASVSDGPTEVSIPPPLYTTKPEFVFNLKCLTSDSRDLLYSPRDAPNPQELCNRSSLDQGQATALLNALRRGMALIQGPPGTGKSYTGEAIIKVLLANKKRAKIGPILCVCYTNHALDQLLEHLWHGGVKQIIRIGSRSKSSILEKLNLRKLEKEADRTRAEKHAAGRTFSVLARVETDIRNYLSGLRASKIAQKVKSHIEVDAKPFHDAIFEPGVEDDWTAVTHKDAWACFLGWVEAGPVLEIEVRDADALKKENPGALSRQERSALYTAWCSEVTADLEDEFVSLHDDYQNAKKEFQTVIREVDLRLLEEADIVGVTTTGLAKNLDMLRKLDTKVLLGEEAGEVLEGHILTALLPSVEHVILIGDHLQLRPQVTNYELSVANPRGEQYSLDVSLFERLVRPVRPTDLKLPFDMLEIQRRMHPSISSLIRNTVYDSLKDANQVNDYPEVVGMRKRLFWFDHDRPEARSDPNHPTSTSRTNDFEVEMVCALVSHLVRQGEYGRDDIAVITPYLGQLHKLRKRLQSSFEIVLDDRDLDELRSEGLDAPPQVFKQVLGSCLRLVTVDNFQGEEAKVVVISLVRSNRERQCGFLKTTNRINVLLSRAKHGMYIFGNTATYGEVEMWSKVISMLEENGNVGSKLQLQCPRHRDTPIEISDLDDFVRLSPEAGCNAQCLKKLECGHTCLSKCHATPLHMAVRCLEPCLRLNVKCSHACPRLCGEPCEKECSTVLEDQVLALPCGHSLAAPRCWQVQMPHRVNCNERVRKIVPGCHHDVEVPCRENVTKDGFVCNTLCGKLLPCGHACDDTCKACMTRVGGAITSENHRPVCRHCRGSLQNILRYGRVVRQTLLDESTKKFISWSHTQSMELEQRLIDEQERLNQSGRSGRLLALFARAGDIYINGNPVDQMLAIHDWIGDDRYKPIINLYFKMLDYLNHIRVEEQPYQRVFYLVQHARRTGETTGEFDLDPSKIQTRGQLLAKTMLFRCYMVVLSDFLRLESEATRNFTILHFKIDKSLEDCERLITQAKETKYVRQELEGHIFFTKLVALVQQMNVTGLTHGEELPESAMARAESHISEAEALILKYPSTALLRKEFDEVERMLSNGVFYREVSVEEKRAVWMAMAQEFSGTGPWYACAQGHPFTVSDHGLPMEAAKCPECGAPVRGEDHELAEGVQHDEAMKLQLHG
ncbi:putative NF-X1 finger and helicase domain protein [Hypoxylon sp. NC1633]|nr:putative NF-X1 finger and helicase domain protein [Hypoxylon sp. NC1633]